MPEAFYNILTTLGLNALANAQATQTPLPLVNFAVGDSNGVYSAPVVGQIALVNEVWRGTINRVYVSLKDASHIVVEALIPAADGGFNVREAGVFDGAGNLIAVGKYPLTFKPALGSGSEKDLYVRMIMQVTNAANVDQTIDPTLIYLTQWHLDEHADLRNNPHVVTVAQIGAETPAGAQTKVDTHRDVAAPHSGHETPAGAQTKVDTHRDVAAPHSGHETPAGAQAKVDASISALMSAPPAVLDTLNELAAALGDDPNFATTMVNALATKETPAGAQAKVNALLPSGTRMVFVQAAAPTGWTKVLGMDGRGIRLVDGVGGGLAGNSDAFGAHTHSVGEHGHGHTLSVASHTLTVSEMPIHAHTLSATDTVESNDPAGGSYLAGVASSPVTATTSNSGGGAGHGHGVSGAVSNSAAFNTSSFVPKYVNSIVCSKD